jgi:hypothetical protein
LQKVEQGDQVLAKQCRSQPFERLDAVGNDPFPAREKPAASDVQPEDGDFPKAMTAAGTTGTRTSFDVVRAWNWRRSNLCLSPFAQFK